MCLLMRYMYFQPNLLKKRYLEMFWKKYKISKKILKTTHFRQFLEFYKFCETKYVCRLSANHIRVRQQFKVRNCDIFACMWWILVSYNDHRVQKSHLNLSQNLRFQPKYSDFDDIVVKRMGSRMTGSYDLSTKNSHRK